MAVHLPPIPQLLACMLLKPAADIVSQPKIIKILKKKIKVATNLLKIIKTISMLSC